MSMVTRLLLVGCLCLLAPSRLSAGTLSVSAAVSLKETITEVASQYEKETGDRVDLTFGASGQLEAQIKAGAPVDLFISAANKQVDELIKAGLADNASRRVAAGNSLVLVVAPGASAPTGFAGLSDPAVKKIGIGEPKTVPAGQYAMQALKAMKLEAAVTDRIVFGSSVRQVLDYVERGEVSAGIVYATDAKQAGDKVKVVEVADPSTHDPIIYPAVVIGASHDPTGARKFLDYLTSEKARTIFAAHGFSDGPVPPSKVPAADR